MEGWTKRRSRPCMQAGMVDETALGLHNRPATSNPSVHTLSKHPCSACRRTGEQQQAWELALGTLQRRRRSSAIAPMQPGSAGPTIATPADRYQRGTFSCNPGTLCDKPQCELCICLDVVIFLLPLPSLPPVAAMCLCLCHRHLFPSASLHHRNLSVCLAYR